MPVIYRPKVLGSCGLEWWRSWGEGRGESVSGFEWQVSGENWGCREWREKLVMVNSTSNVYDRGSLRIFFEQRISSIRVIEEEVGDELK
nr:hypothetical protein [Tanacetum cinerariifolium]